jgi:hypothetical protein
MTEAVSHVDHVYLKGGLVAYSRISWKAPGRFFCVGSECKLNASMSRSEKSRYKRCR